MAVPPSTTHAIATPAQPDAIPLLAAPSGAAPGEEWEQGPVGGRSVRNVTDPTLTPVLPDPAKATGVAVIVAPGGAFYTLTMDDEGFGVAHWLADHGVAAFVLKYRLEATPLDYADYKSVLHKRLIDAVQGTAKLETPALALEDAKAAVRLVRARAASWGVDPARVGFIGFSAGAMTALSIGLSDDKAARPDFIAPIYGPMVARSAPADAPPMFLAIALDDPIFARGRDLGLIDSWRAAGRPIEVHLYERGGHGFAAGKSAATKLWIEEFYAWMQDRHLLAVTR